MQEVKALEDIGLTKSEAKVYMALLDLGSATRGPIVEKSGVASSKIYELLEKLMQKGLVSVVIKKGVKYYEAASPTRVLDYLKEKENRIHEEIETVKNILPNLELKQKLSKEKSEISVYKSMKGIETIYQIILNTLKKGEEYYIFGAVAGGVTETQRIFLTKYHQKRFEKGIKLKLIFHKGIGYVQKPFTNMKLADIKYMDPRLIGPAQTMIVKNKVIIILWSENPLGVIIENKEIADNYKKYFDFLWGMAKK